jgi:hypothetical protein
MTDLQRDIATALYLWRLDRDLAAADALSDWLCEQVDADRQLGRAMDVVDRWHWCGLVERE